MTSTKYLLIIFISIVGPALVSAQWHNIIQPKGYYLVDNYVDRHGNIFISNDSTYYSDDQGKSWQTVDLSNGISTLKETNNGDLYSDNGNTIWKFNYNTKLLELFHWDNKLYTIDHQGYLWYFGDKGYYFAKDKNSPWEFISTGLDAYDCGFSVVESYLEHYKLIYDHCNSGVLFRYDINGTKLLTGPPGYCTYAFVNQATGTIFGVSDNKLYRSTDKGDNFTYISTAGILPEYAVMSNTPNGRILIQPDMMYSDDDGLTWAKVKDNYISGPKPEQLIGNFINNSDTVIITDGPCKKESIYRSIDKGANWEIVKNALSIPKIEKYVEDKSGNLFAVACSDSTVQVTYDNGNSWDGFLLKINGKEYIINDIGVNAAGDIFATSHGYLYKSIDGGANFSKLNVPDNQLSYTDPLKLFVAKDKYIYIFNSVTGLISVDNGSSWQTITFGSIISKNARIDNNGNLYYIDGLNMLSYYDRFTDQNKVLYNDYIYDYNISPNGSLYYIADNDVFITKDKFKTTKKIKDYDSIIIHKIFTDKNNDVYFYDFQQPGFIYISSDEGLTLDTFTKVPVNDYDQFFYISAFDNLYAISINKVYKFDSKLDYKLLVKGKTYNDEDKSCSYKISEKLKSSVQVVASGSNEVRSYSDINGTYRLRVPEGGYTLTSLPPNDLWDSCPEENLNITLGQNDINLDLGLKAKFICPYMSIDVQMPFMRRCFDNKIYIKYCNEGTDIAYDIKLTVTLNGKMAYLSSTVAPISQSGNEVVYSLGDIPAGFCGTIEILAKLDCSAVSDESICVLAKLTPVAQCTNNLPRRAEINKCLKVTGSFDPNDKTAFIKGSPAEGKTEMNEEVEYLIRFQNTGTDTAFRVVIEDQIPEGFDINTLRLLNSSHPYTLEIDDKQIVRFILDPIMLPDSNVNEAASHGFVAFKISPYPNLDYGSKLDNFADIYFDFNAAVRTNTELLTVAKAVSTLNQNAGIQFSYYPNPARDELNIKMKEDQSGIYILSITDILGNNILRETFLNRNYTLKDLSSISPGIYLLNIEDEKGKHGFGKLVIQ